MSWRQWFVPNERTLISPFFDVMLAGGFSLLLYAFFAFSGAAQPSLAAWSLALYYAAFLVNAPHFLASYQLLYGDARASFFSWRERPKFTLKLWWAGLAVPLVLVSYFVWAWRGADLVAMGYLVNAMFFFVGWHYVKQIYGCFIVLSAAQKTYYGPIERWMALLPLYALWALSYVGFNTGATPNVFYSIPYTSFAWSPDWLQIIKFLLCLFTVGFLVMLIRRWWIKAPLPPLSALVAFLSIYLWYLPSFYHPWYFYAIPLLHSLQYLLFVVAARRNAAVKTGQSTHSIAQTTTELTWLGMGLFVLFPVVIIAWLLLSPYWPTVEQHFLFWGRGFGYDSRFLFWVGVLLAIGGLMAWFNRRLPRGPKARFLVFFATTYLLGFLSFAFIPDTLDMLARQGMLWTPLIYPAVFGGSLYLFFFTLFINVHHYFIDNVIWKSDNVHMRGLLFASQLAPPPASKP